MNEWTILYINDIPHRITALDTKFFADSADLPCVPVSRHTLKPASVEHVKNGGTVYTSGNSYSLTESEQ